MFDRLRCAWSAFRWAWKHFDPVQEKFMDWPRHIESWMVNRMSFQIGDFEYIRGKEPYDAKWGASNVIPNATEPFMLKKHVVDKEGRARYFNVIPEGYDPVVYKSSWED